MSIRVLQYIRELGAVPMSQERPCTPASNGEIRRWCEQGAVLFNSERVSATEDVDFPVFSLVFFPKSEARRTTVV